MAPPIHLGAWSMGSKVVKYWHAFGFGLVMCVWVMYLVRFKGSKVYFAVDPQGGISNAYKNK